MINLQNIPFHPIIIIGIILMTVGAKGMIEEVFKKDIQEKEINHLIINK